VPWTFVRPADPSILSELPLLDVGTGDAQTLRKVVGDDGLVVGVDRSIEVLRAARRAGAGRLIASDVSSLPFRAGSFATVLAADLLHHIDDAMVPRVLEAIRDVLRPGGRLVAWWYATRAHPAPDAPSYPRSYEGVAGFAKAVALTDIRPLELEVVLPAGPETVGLTALRG
jgi:SAM-dependent methyltransferase